MTWRKKAFYRRELFGMIVILSSVWRFRLSFFQTISGAGSASATQFKMAVDPPSMVRVWGGSTLKVGGTGQQNQRSNNHDACKG